MMSTHQHIQFSSVTQVTMIKTATFVNYAYNISTTEQATVVFISHLNTLRHFGHTLLHTALLSAETIPNTKKMKTTEKNTKAKRISR